MAKKGKSSRDSIRHAFDNILIERFWRGVQYEEVNLNDYNSMNTAHR